MWLTGILQWGLGGTGKTVYWKQEGNYFNEHRYDTACHTPYRSNSHDEAKPGNNATTSLEESPAGARSVIMSLSVGPWGQNSSMTVALGKRSFFSAHKQGHPQWTVLTETSFDVFLCKLLLEQHISTNQPLIPSRTYSFDIKYTSWRSWGPWGPRQARRALVRERERRKISDQNKPMELQTGTPKALHIETKDSVSLIQGKLAILHWSRSLKATKIHQSASASQIGTCWLATLRTPARLEGWLPFTKMCVSSLSCNLKTWHKAVFTFQSTSV